MPTHPLFVQTNSAYEFMGIYKQQNGINEHIPHFRPQKVINSFKTVLQQGKKRA